MTKDIIEAERARFSALSPDEAKAILAHMEGQATAMRSCWYCNSAHEHLKKADHPILCFGCGAWYISGYPAPVVVLRAGDKPITDEVMRDMVAYTTERDDG